MLLKLVIFVCNALNNVLAVLVLKQIVNLVPILQENLHLIAHVNLDILKMVVQLADNVVQTVFLVRVVLQYVHNVKFLNTTYHSVNMEKVFSL